MENNSIDAQDLILWMLRLEKDPDSVQVEEKERYIILSSFSDSNSLAVNIYDLGALVQEMIKAYEGKHLELDEYELICRGFLVCDQKLNYMNADVHAAGMYLFRHIIAIYRTHRQLLLKKLLPYLSK